MRLIPLDEEEKDPDAPLRLVPMDANHGGGMRLIPLDEPGIPESKNSPAIPVKAPIVEDLPELSPAVNAYRKALAAYQNKDEAGISAPLEEALRLDPSLVDAVGLKNAIERERAAGRPLFAEPKNVMDVESFKELGGEKDIFDRAATVAADLTRRVTPAPTGLENRPKTAQDAARAALTPILALSAPIRSEQGQRMAGAAGAGVAGSMASMVAAEPALEAFAGVDTPAGKLAMKASDKLSALAQDLQPDDPTFAEALASGAGSMALFIVPGTATGKIVSAIPKMGVLAARLAPALATGLPVILESATEAGGVFQKMVADGKPREEAGKAAAKTFFANGILIGLTNKFGLNAEGAVALKKALMSAPMEAIQEAGQSIISALSSGDEVDWEDVATSAGVGAIIGAGTGGLTAGAQPEKAAAAAPASQKTAPAQPVAAFTPATVGQKTVETVANQFPTMAKVLAGKPIPVPQEALNEGIRKAAVAGEAELIRSGDPMAADKVAMETFAKSLQPASGPASSQATPPDAGAIQESQDMENDAIEPPEVVQVGGKAPREAVMAHARALYKAAAQERMDSMSDLERFIIENGGIRAPTDKSLSEEFQKFPLHLKGRTQWDEMEQDARDARLLAPGQTLEQAINAFKRRGKRPTLTEFIGQAQRELDHEYEVYGPPKEGLKTAPGREEVVPFEGREEYGSVKESGPAYNPEGAIFYSQLQKTLDQKMPANAPADQVRNILKGGAVKQDEIDWSGIEDFLKGKTKVSKAELLDFLRGNEVKVQEVVKGRGISKEEQERLDALRDASNERDLSASEMKEYDALAVKEEQSVGKSDSTKFSSYQLPGGENYRELLLRLPEKPRSESDLIWRKAVTGKWAFFGPDGEQLSGAFPRESDMESARSTISSGRPRGFRTAHFDEPNILAHVRLNDRTTADGKKMLFLEEVQSDWMQEGRKKGFRGEPKYYVADANQVSGRFSQNFDTMEEAEAYAKTLVGKFEVRTTVNEDGVPDAPFKKTWHELALKRMLRYAVDNGYDSIGWTTGEQQADRYDLSKQVDAIRYAKRKDGTFDISVFKGENPVVVKDKQSPGDLEGLVGKEMARKIVDGIGKKSTSAAGYESIGDLEGIDLKVGGEGMKGFYDQIIPSFLNKYTKKWGGRVGEAEIKTDDARQVWNVYNRGGDLLSSHGSEVSAENASGRYPGSTVKAETTETENKSVHSLEITPSMRESVKAGQALFEKKAEFDALREKQPGLFGGAEPIIIKRGKPGDPAQMTLFGQKAQPKFDLPESAFKPEEIRLSPQAKQLSMTSEGKHQADMIFPRALQESVVIRDLVEKGYLPVPKMKIGSPEDTAAIFHFLKNESVESFYVVSMDEENNIIGSELVSVGTLDSTLVHPRDALKGATMLGAKKISIIHNHPSGDPTPSTEDKVLTKRLAAAAKSAGIEMAHHVVINDKKYGVIQPDGTVSMEERGKKPQMTGQMRVVKPARAGESDGPKITSPSIAMEYVKGIQGSRKGVVVIAMDTKLKPTGVWHVGESFQSVDQMAGEIGKISMRNNARGVVIVSDRMPTPKYMRDLNAKMDATWGVEIFDVTSAENGDVNSARAMGILRDTPEPYGGEEVKPEGKESPGQKVAQSIYDENRRAARRGWFSKTTEELTKAGKDAKTGFFAKNLAPLSHTLKSIAPEIKSRMRRFEFDVSRKTAADIKAAMPFIESVKKLSQEDRVDLDLARKNGDTAKITGILSRNGLMDKYREVRSVLNSIYWRAKSAGMKLDFRAEYNPRIMKDAEGFMNAVMTRENASEIMAAIREQEKALKKTLTVEERAALVNSMLRGYGPNKITLTPPGNVKRRTREIVDAGTNPYYYDSDAALLMYLERMNEAIEARRFFGKGSKDMPLDTINDSIGAYTLDLVAQGKISPQDEMRLREALQSRFSDKKMSLFWKTYRDTSYLETMGSFSSALTQIEDLAMAWYRGGLLGGTKAIGKAATGNAKVTAKDLGIDKVSQEFRDGRQIQNALEKVFKVIGLEKLDAVGKNSTLEAALESYQREARAGQFSPGNLRRIREAFGEEGSTQIMEDLAEGKITQDVKFLLFSDLLDVQPIAKSEMAQGYLESGDARIFWMLKSFLIKRLNYTLDETVRLMGKPETRMEGIQNMFRLLPLMVLAGMGADKIKDITFNRFTTLSDRVADNIFKLFAISKFTVYEARQRGLSKAIYGMFLPPMKLVDSIGRDTYSLYRAANEGKEFDGFETVASIPVVGKLFYWWLGKGSKKTEKAREKAGAGRETRPASSRPAVQRQSASREVVRR
jgi:hypothetical protein